jgi:hypothetical protein
LDRPKPVQLAYGCTGLARGLLSEDFFVAMKLIHHRQQSLRKLTHRNSAALRHSVKYRESLLRSVGVGDDRDEM